MHAPNAESVGRYLQSLKGKPVRVLDITPLIDDRATVDGDAPLRIDFEIGGRRQRAILERVSACPAACEHAADLAREVVFEHKGTHRLPRHVRSIDVGAVEKGGKLVSLSRAEEFFVLKDCAEGHAYADDLERMERSGVVEDLDTARCDALCDYLLAIHRETGPDPALYAQRLREIIGQGEGVLSLSDAWREAPGGLTRGELEEIERGVLAWRWRIRDRASRLRQVHGDFRPDNVLFRTACDFSVLGRSHGAWGEPADDLACLTMHYLVGAVRSRGTFDGPLRGLFRRFWSRYLLGSGDGEILEVAPPFVAWRALELTRPERAPELGARERRLLARFVRRVLAAPVFDPEQVDAYLDGA